MLPDEQIGETVRFDMVFPGKEGAPDVEVMAFAEGRTNMLVVHRNAALSSLGVDFLPGWAVTHKGTGRCLTQGLGAPDRAAAVALAARIYGWVGEIEPVGSAEAVTQAYLRACPDLRARIEAFCADAWDAPRPTQQCALEAAR